MSDCFDRASVARAADILMEMFGFDDWSEALERARLVEQQAIGQAFAAAVRCEIERRVAIAGRISDAAEDG